MVGEAEMLKKKKTKLEIEARGIDIRNLEDGIGYESRDSCQTNNAERQKRRKEGW